VSLWDGDRCIFANDDGRPGLSPLGGQFIAGVLAHGAALTALAAPMVNSYKRLVVGESLSGTSWAPAYVAHGPNNRTAVVRTLDGRFEWRLPDASANPYLALAGLVAAGLDGIDRALDPGPACTDDLFALDLAQIRARGIPLLPQSLQEALDALRADEAVRGALGESLAAEFDRLKRAEWTEYARHVSTPQMKIAVSMDETSDWKARSPLRKFRKWQKKPCACGTRVSTKRSVLRTRSRTFFLSSQPRRSAMHMPPSPKPVAAMLATLRESDPSAWLRSFTSPV